MANDYERLETNMGDYGRGTLASYKGLERDPQVESLLRNRTRELGISKETTRELSRDLAASVSFERTRSIGMGL